MKVARVVNFDVSFLPAVVNENREVLGVLSVEEDFLTVPDNFNKIVLTFMRKTVSLLSRDWVCVRCVPA